MGKNGLPSRVVVSVSTATEQRGALQRSPSTLRSAVDAEEEKEELGRAEPEGEVLIFISPRSSAASRA